MSKLVQGVGINDRTYPANINGKATKEYNLWTAMLSRCYSASELEKHPTYIGCSVSDTFKCYSLFYEWCHGQIGFGMSGFQLDKDLLIKGNKQYSEHTCIFIPKYLNSLLTNSRLSRGPLPIGVTKEGNSFQAQCNVLGVKKYLGMFKTPELAFNAYKTFKEDYIKQQAELYKNSIDVRAYNALINYIISIED